jgi:hypothetical protein
MNQPFHRHSAGTHVHHETFGVLTEHLIIRPRRKDPSLAASLSNWEPGSNDAYHPAHHPLSIYIAESDHDAGTKQLR